MLAASAKLGHTCRSSGFTLAQLQWLLPDHNSCPPCLWQVEFKLSPRIAVRRQKLTLPVYFPYVLFWCTASCNRGKTRMLTEAFIINISGLPVSAPFISPLNGAVICTEDLTQSLMQVLGQQCESVHTLSVLFLARRVYA